MSVDNTLFGKCGFRVKNGLKITATVISFLICVSAMGGSDEHWKAFTSRSGWTIKYPIGWRIASCHSCSNPKAEGMFVDFFPPEKQEAGGWVMVSPLACKPANTPADPWLTEVAANANQNPHMSEKRLTLGGNPALTVRYRTSKGSFMDEVYIVSGSHTFSIEFGGEKDGTPPENAQNYPVFRGMVESFRVHSTSNCTITRRPGLSK